MWNILHNSACNPPKWLKDRLYLISPATHDMDASELNDIADNIYITTFRKGTIIVNQKCTISDLYILIKGKLELIFEDDDGKFYNLTKIDDKQMYYIGIEPFETDEENPL